MGPILYVYMHFVKAVADTWCQREVRLKQAAVGKAKPR
jgi:hypothetical protein